MRLYHATTPDRAAEILRGGFRDAYVGRDIDTGVGVGAVWFTSNPGGEPDQDLDAEVVVIAVNFPAEIAERLRPDETEVIAIEGIESPAYYGCIEAATVNEFHREVVV